MLVWFCIRAKLRAHTLRHPCLACPSRCIDPLYFYNLLKSTSTASPRAKLASLVKGEVLSPEKIRATTGGIASPPSLAPHQPSQNRTIPSHFAMLTSVCADTLSHPHYPLPRTMSLPPLSKVRCCRPKKFGRLPEGLSLHQPFQNRTIPLAFRRARACVCLVGFASIAIVVVCGRCVTASSAISVAASCSDSHLCRCIVQRLSVTDFMHPCIPTFCDHL